MSVTHSSLASLPLSSDNIIEIFPLGNHPWAMEGMWLALHHLGHRFLIEYSMIPGFVVDCSGEAVFPLGLLSARVFLVCWRPAWEWSQHRERKSRAKRWGHQDQILRASFEFLDPAVPEANFFLFLYIFLIKMFDPLNFPSSYLLSFLPKPVWSISSTRGILTNSHNNSWFALIVPSRLWALSRHF